MALTLWSWMLLAAPVSAAVGTPPPKGAIPLRHGGSVSALRFTPDGKTLISASEDGLIRLWDPATGQERRRLEGHTGAVRSLALAPDGNRLASGGADLTVRLWDLAAGKQVRLFQGNRRAVASLTFSPDGRRLAWVDTASPLA
jgi:WD40 repeat protein